MTTSLKLAQITTPLQDMIIIGDDHALYLLAFVDSEDVEAHLTRIKKRTGLNILSGVTEPILLVQQECKHYFNGTLKQFTTPLHFLGSPFQQSVWNALQNIPYGETRSYAALAHAVGNPKAHRAVAGANHVNPFTIIVPCHRVIYADGSLGGYAGGLARKQWLLDHERKN